MKTIKSFITRANRLIEANYNNLPKKLNAIYMYFLSKINPLDSDYQVWFSRYDYTKFMKFKKINTTDFKKNIEDLLKREFIVQGRKMKLFADLKTEYRNVEIDGKQLNVQYFCLIPAFDLSYYIFNLKENYTKIDAEIVRILSSNKNTLRIYEFSKQNLGLEKRCVSIDDLKKYIGISGKYPEFKDFNLKVLKPAEKMINESSDLIVKFNKIKRGKKVVSIEFEITSKVAEKSSLADCPQALKDYARITGKLFSNDELKDIALFLADLPESQRKATLKTEFYKLQQRRKRLRAKNIPLFRNFIAHIQTAVGDILDEIERNGGQINYAYG